MNALKNLFYRATARAEVAKGEAKALASKKLKGATAVEYILILSIMVTVIIVVWRTLLKPAIEGRGGEIATEITTG